MMSSHLSLCCLSPCPSQPHQLPVGVSRHRVFPLPVVSPSGVLPVTGEGTGRWAHRPNLALRSVGGSATSRPVLKASRAEPEWTVRPSGGESATVQADCRHSRKCGGRRKRHSSVVLSSSFCSPTINEEIEDKTCFIKLCLNFDFQP